MGYCADKLCDGRMDWRTDWRTDWWTDRRRQRQYPEAQEISRNFATLEVTNLKSLFSRRHTSIFNCWVPMPSFSSGLFRHTVRWKSHLRWIDLIPCLHTRPTWEVTRWHHNMETWLRHDKEKRSSLLVLCEGNHRWSSSLRASRVQRLNVSLSVAWPKYWTNSWAAGDLRRRDAEVTLRIPHKTGSF